jgi:pyruvate,water dikinase
MTSLVAIHGNGGGGFRFARMSDHVPAGIRLERVTLPGFGGRPADPALRTVSDYAEALWDEIADLPRPLVVLGHGIGGSIALDLIQRHAVDGLILHAPVGTRLERRLFPRLMKPQPVRHLVRWGISSRVTRPLLRRRFFGGAVPPAYADQFLAEYGRAESFGQMFDIITADWWHSLRPSHVPTVLLWGAGDRVLGADQLEDYRRLLPEHNIDIVPGWGHFPMATDPAAYTTRVVDWAQRLSSQPESRQFVVLGSGTATANDIAPKAALLDRAARAGLAVPTGIVVPDGCELTRAPSWVKAPFAVRSAFGTEDGAVRSMAGHFETVLRVQDDAVPAAISEVRASAGETPRIRRDVLLMEMIDAEVAGVAFTEPGYADDLVEWTAGTAENLVAGTETGTSHRLARLEPGERPRATGWQARLALLLCDTRTEFGDQPWDIEWADDGSRCFLIQIRPITVPTRRDDWFTMANHREILPDPPSVFMTSVIAEGSPQLLDYYRRFDPTLSDRRLFIEVFDHRPMINLSLMTDFMRSLGLPTRLVTDSIGGGAEQEHRLSPLRALRRLPVLLRLAWGQLRAARYAHTRLEEMRTLVARNAVSLSEGVDRARIAYVATVHGMTALNTAAAAPTGLLRAAGTLAAHGARQETEATAMFRELDVLRGMLSDGERAGVGAGRMPSSAEFQEAWQRWLEHHGHRGPYESDLSRPRYVEDPRPIFDVLASGRPFHHRVPRWSLRQLLTLPLWWVARVPMARRERFRSDAMHVFLRLRTDLLRLASDRGVGEELWLLTADEVRLLDDGRQPDAALLAQRRAELEDAKARPMPDLISRFGSHGGEHERRRGIGLVAGVVMGRAWVLDEPSTRPPSALSGVPLVLIAPSVDAGWLPTFSLVEAVAVEMGGDLSHGSIILREVGRPAVTNNAGLRSRIQTGDRVRVDGNIGLVEVLD